VSPLRAVVFDWRGTLVVTHSAEEWVRAGLVAVGREPDLGTVYRVVGALDWDSLNAPGTDRSAAAHQRAFESAFARAGVDDALAAALYAIESDPLATPFAADAAGVLTRLHDAGIAIAVLSDIHFDIRPAFAAVGLADCVDVYALSFELGVQKPDPMIFRRVLELLGTTAEETLMVGDRAAYDGAAVEAGIATLLLPPLRGTQDARLHLVEQLVIGPAHSA
jgi:HAD superfamily hydrolase (TIGR01509 family)